MSITNWSRTAPSLTDLRTFIASSRPWLAVIVGLHLIAAALLWWTEYEAVHFALFILAWGLFNFAFLVVLRRPALAAALSLLLFYGLIAISQFKVGITWWTITFLDFLMVEPETAAFLFTVHPQLRVTLLVAAAVVVPLLIVVWRFDPFKVRRRISALGGAACLAALTGLSLAVPEQPWEPFQGVNHVSNFVRSGVTAVSELFRQGWLDADAGGSAAGQLPFVTADGCHAPGRRPHIIMVLDESSFDITAAPGIRVPPDYRRHFRSFDGKQRSFILDATGGPTWYAEYSVLTGLSPRSFGRFMFYVTRIAAGHVERGLPQALRRCGYRTFSLYPDDGNFLSARHFQQTAGIDHFTDMRDMGATEIEPDHYYYDQTVRTIAREKGSAPLFIFTYVTANHFPWDKSYRPDLTPDWKSLGNETSIDEYIRRQTMSARDYRDFVARLKREFPDESFLIVRFGDHQPWISSRVLEPELSEAQVARKVMAYDPRYFTTYYAIDAVNFKPVDVSSALDALEAPYLPLVIQEAAGLPLDPTFVEQKKIMQRCNGLFYRCEAGAQARRFNRLLIDAGLIKGL